jgi:hypothetical protein
MGDDAWRKVVHEFLPYERVEEEGFVASAAETLGVFLRRGKALHLASIS